MEINFYAKTLPIKSFLPPMRLAIESIYKHIIQAIVLWKPTFMLGREWACASVHGRERARMSAHGRAVGVHDRARACTERARGVHMTRSFEVVHCRTQLTEVCSKMFLYKILY